MRFHELFNILKESPDKMVIPYNGDDPYATWDKDDIMRWHDEDAVCFISTPQTVVYAVDVDTMHGELIGFLIENDVESFKVYNTSTRDELLEKYITANKNHNSSKFNLGRFTREESITKFPQIIFGRLWSDRQGCSFWNPPKSFTQESVNTIIDFISNTFGNVDDYVFEIFGINEQKWEKIDLKEFSQLGKAGIAKNDTKGPELGQIHTIDPSLKGQVMKQKGIKPKTAMGVEKRFMMGENKNEIL